MRIAPLLGIIVLMVVIGAAIGTTLLWIIAGLSLAALVGLIVIMSRQGMVVGPRVLIDDVKERFEEAGREPDTSEQKVVIVEDRRDSEQSK